MRKLINKFISTGEFVHTSQRLSQQELWILGMSIILTFIIKLILIPYNMMDMGDSATRVWNAWWWALDPFFVNPQSGHPFWFYFMGPILMLTREIFFTPIIIMAFIMSVTGYYLFRISNIFFSFRASMFAFLIFTFNPVIFRLNYEPYALQPSHMFIVIMVYYLILALITNDGKRNFTIAGLMGFFALGFRPEALFIILAFAFLIFLTDKKGKWNYIILSLSFQIIWIFISMAINGEPFRTFNAADQYTDPVNISEISLGLRLRGFFLPYYFLILGLTIILFYFFVRGLIYTWRKYPKVFTLLLLMPVLVPSLINGVMSAKSVIYHTTHYIYLVFYFAPVFAGIGLELYVKNFRDKKAGIAIAGLIILSAIPLSYIKEFVPQNFNRLFPKIIQFIVTADEPEETRKLIRIIDENITEYPSLIFDADDNASSILYVPFRTKLAPPDKILISSYNVPVNPEELKDEILIFMQRNRKGLIMFRKNAPTVMNRLFTEYFIPEYPQLIMLEETDEWKVYIFELEINML